LVLHHTVSGAAGTIDCSIAELTSGTAAAFTLALNGSSLTADGTVIVSTASLISNTADSNPANDSASANVTFATPKTDLAVTIVASGDTVAPAVVDV
jgi:hypothetical protein